VVGLGRSAIRATFSPAVAVGTSTARRASTAGSPAVNVLRGVNS
jgi:hypothetical protein